MGAGLTGLTLAYRLSRQGFRVSLIDRNSPNSSSPHRQSMDTIEGQTHTAALHHSSNHLPIVVHRFQQATWNLLKELQLTSLVTDTQAVPFEFVLPAHQLRSFHPVYAPSPFHTLFRLLLFQGMPFSDRWALLKKVEQYWEGELTVPQNIDSQSVKAWLTTHQQSRQACEAIWNSLCVFFLGTKSEESSARYFTTLLRQCFLSARTHHRTFIPALDEESLFLSPLRSFFATQPMNRLFHSIVSYFQCDGPHISSVKLSDGTALTADMYVSALPRRRLMACLPERLQAKFAYFSNLSQLDDQTLLTTQCELSIGIDKPRFLLFSDPCGWMTIRPSSDPSTAKTHVSWVTLSKPDIQSPSTQEDLEPISFLFPQLFKKSLSQLTPTNIRKTFQTFTACHPNNSSFRPLPKSPLTNLFVTGPWTDTGLPSSRESSIVSADSCATELIQNLTQR